MNVLLLGGGLQGLSCGESLSNKKNYSVAAVSCGLDIIHSRLFDKVYQIKDLGYEETLRKIFGDTHYDVIIPMGDNAASFLSEKNRKLKDNMTQSVQWLIMGVFPLLRIKPHL